MPPVTHWGLRWIQLLQTAKETDVKHTICFSFLVIFYFFYFGSCGRLSWLNCPLSSARLYSIFTYLLTYLLKTCTNEWRGNLREISEVCVRNTDRKFKQKAGEGKTKYTYKTACFFSAVPFCAAPPSASSTLRSPSVSCFRLFSTVTLVTGFHLSGSVK